MTFIDVVLGFFLIVFMFMGYKSGFVQKIIGIMCFAVALVIATKYSSDISEIVYEPIGVTGRMGFILAFLTIVLGITLMQSFIYKAL
ncbi:MAG: CvpA family protein, partial [Bacteroidota bacterium]|nr:CvpA family protein [Bacteroidota bacterium]